MRSGSLLKEMAERGERVAQGGDRKSKARGATLAELHDLGISRSQARTGLRKTVFGSWTKRAFELSEIEKCHDLTNFADAEAMTCKDVTPAMDGARGRDSGRSDGFEDDIRSR